MSKNFWYYASAGGSGMMMPAGSCTDGGGDLAPPEKDKFDQILARFY